MFVLIPSYYIKFYLIDRHFIVQYSSSNSGISKINVDVPQCSILFPLFLNIYAANQANMQQTIVVDYKNSSCLKMKMLYETALSNLQTHPNIIS